MTPGLGWKVLPGTVLATKVYAPVSVAVIAVAATTVTPLDTTNLTISFVVPASGIVDMRGTAPVQATRGATQMNLWAAFTNHSGGARVGDAFLVISLPTTAPVSLTLNVPFEIHLTGLTPGALQLDLAAGFSGTGGACNFVASSAPSLTVATLNAGGSPIVLQAVASV